MQSGFSGMSAVYALTEVVDHILVEAFDAVVGERGEVAGRSRGLALVAVGGYGRMEVAPYSDIDIMLLSKDRNSVNTNAAQDVLYRMWDIGLNISHSFRTLSECVEDSLSDLKTRTSLIESRFLAGSMDVFQEFKRDIYQKLLFKDRKDFIRDMLRETDGRHKTYGDTVYLLEPNIKEGRGGLRDIHSVSWFARVVLRMNGLGDLKGMLSGSDYKHFMKAFDFLLKARLCLHSVSKRRNDVLSFEFQEAVAHGLGFKDTKRFLSEEILMRLYFKKAGNVTDVLRKVMHTSGRQYVSFAPSFFIRKITDDFSLSKDEIIIRDKSLLRHTEKVLEAFHVYSITGKQFSAQVREAIRGRAIFISKKKVSKKAAAYFWEILKGNRACATLREMHDTGILDRFIPEFGRLRHLVLYEPYHRYTVDEHTLVALKNIENLKHTQHVKFHYLAETLKGVKQEVLYLSVLLHDVGKGAPQEHSGRHEEYGYRIIKGILERLNIGSNDRTKIEFLVKNHILLSRLALTRDTNAPETITQLAEVVETEENLKALYLMTYADMSAVNPHFWTDWKAYLFHDIFTKTIDHMRGVKGRCFSKPDKKLEGFLEDMPERYLMANAEDTIRSDYALSLKIRTEQVVISINSRPDNTAEINVITGDRPGLFSRIVGALSFRGLNILQARLYTGKTGLVIDKVLLSNWQGIWWQGIEEQIRADLKDIVSEDRQWAAGGRHWGQSPCPPSAGHCLLPVSKRTESFIEIDNETSDEYTILELFLPDRIGLLSDISSQLYLHETDIISAVINTEDAVAWDVFYLQHAGGKLDAETIFNVVNAIQNSAIWSYA